MIGYGGRVKMWEDVFDFQGFIMEIGWFCALKANARIKFLTMMIDFSLYYNCPRLLYRVHLLDSIHLVSLVRILLIRLHTYI